MPTRTLSPTAAVAQSTQSMRPCNLINFPLNRAHVTPDTLTPDQKLKLTLLVRMLGDDIVNGARDSGLGVDDIWSMIADMTFANGMV